MTAQIALTLGITLAALVLFVWNRLAVEVVGLLVLATLLVTGLTTPADGLAGFASEATITVALMLVLSAGLLRTGTVDLLARRLADAAGRSETRLLLAIIVVIVPVSALINNTAAVAILLPAVLGLSRTMRIAPSRVLMPLSFAGQLGGTLTLIGTSTNLLVAGLVLEAGIGRLRLFDITPPAAVLTALGVAYLLTVGRRLVPDRAAPKGLVESYELREYLTALVVADDSRLVGRTLAETRFGDVHGLQIVELRRADGGERVTPPSGHTIVHAGDVLVVTGKVPDIARIEETEHLTIAGARPELRAEAAAATAGSDDPADEPPQLAELLVPLHSHAVGRSVAQLDLRRRYGVTALALQRHGRPVHAAVGRVPLAPGDLVLVQGRSAALTKLHAAGDLALLGPVRLPERRHRKIPLAVAIMAGVVLLPALGVTTIVVSALLGALLMVLTGCLTPQEAYEDMDWSVVVLLAAILPLGTTMRDTGTAAWLAGGLVTTVAPLGPYGVLAAVYLSGVALTSVISNSAAAVVLVPVAIAAAGALGVAPMPFVIAVMLAASSSFITPIGYQTNTFIYGPGGYRFSDFLRVGAPLNLLLAAASTVVIPWFFPF